MSRHVWMRHWEEVCEQHVIWCERCSRNASGTTWWAGLSARCGVCINQRFLLYLKQDLTRVLYALAGHVRQSQVWPALRDTRTSRYQGSMYSVVYFPQTQYIQPRRSERLADKTVSHHTRIQLFSHSRPFASLIPAASADIEQGKLSQQRHGH